MMLPLIILKVGIIRSLDHRIFMFYDRVCLYERRNKLIILDKDVEGSLAVFFCFSV